MIQELVRQHIGILIRHGIKEQQFQYLMRGHPVKAGFQALFFQPLPMTAMVSAAFAIFAHGQAPRILQRPVL